jgi:hypothetical protein
VVRYRTQSRTATVVTGVVIGAFAVLALAIIDQPPT